MADHSKPTLTSNYSTEFIPQLDGRFDDLALGLDPARTSPTNLPQYAIRWSSAAKKWQIWSGTAWGDLAAEYAISISGSAATLKTARTIALSGGATGTATEFDGSTDITIPVTALDASKLEGNIAWARVSTNAPETATRWPAFSEVTGKPAAYPTTWGDVSGKPAFGDAALADEDDLQWLGTPVGGYITPKVAPPTDDPRFRYVLCTAGLTGTGGYNEGVLISESVTGSSPLIEATATVDLDGSPFDGEVIHLINTEGRFVGAGVSEAFQNDHIQNIVGGLGYFNVISGASVATSGAFQNSVPQTASEGGANARNTAYYSFDASNVARTNTYTQPRTHRLPHYRRIK